MGGAPRCQAWAHTCRSSLLEAAQDLLAQEASSVEWPLHARHCGRDRGGRAGKSGECGDLVADGVEIGG